MNLELKNLLFLVSFDVLVFGKKFEFCYYFWLKFQWSFMSRFKSFETSKNPFLGVLKLCESLWNFVKLCYWNFNKFHWNFMLFQNNWNFGTLHPVAFSRLRYFSFQKGVRTLGRHRIGKNENRGKGKSRESEHVFF